MIYVIIFIATIALVLLVMLSFKGRPPSERNPDGRNAVSRSRDGGSSSH
jgi:hypothetical protein